MILSLLLYVFAVEYIIMSNPGFRGYAPVPHHQYNILRLVMLGVGLLDLALIPYLRKRALSGRVRQRGAAAAPGPPGRLLIASILAFALCESLAIYGLVLFLVNGLRQDFYLFLGLSVVAAMINFPRFERWLAWAAEMDTKSAV
jgi:hypothetical protein